jgi:bifunctional DNA-binding transcriptional regulator/antitoxin component of YhaV-PrlF toxin-antitoxin module
MAKSMAAQVVDQPRTRIVRPLRGGQMTIPVEFRRELGIDDETLLQVTLEGGELRIRPMRPEERAGNNEWFRGLYALFAPVRDEAVAREYSEEEIDRAIDEAVTEVRRVRRTRG